MDDKKKLPAGMLATERFPRAARAVSAARAFGMRLIEDGPDYNMAYYRALSSLHTMEHRSDRATAMMREILNSDHRIKSVELWEAKGDGFRISSREGGPPVSTRPEERDFIKYTSDFRASKSRDGYVVIFNGGTTTLLNSLPGDFRVEGLAKDLSFGCEGCWVPVGPLVDKKMAVTHLLAVYGHISRETGPANHQLNFIVSMSRLIGDQLYSQRVAERANIDPVTGLLNRRVLDQRVFEASLESIVRRRSVALAFVDLDLFKRINDSYDHAIGDQVLGAVGSALRFRGSGLPAKYGGEEFVILEFDLSASVAREKATELHYLFSPLHCETRAGILEVRASMGVFSSFMWEALRRANSIHLEPFSVPIEEKERMEGRLVSALVQRDALLRLREAADEEIRKLREFDSVARRYSSSREFEAMLRSVSGPLKEYAEKWGKLMIHLADSAMYFVKNSGRDGIAMPVIRDGTLSFERLKPQEPSGSSGAEGDPRQLSLRDRRSYPPSPSEGPHQ